MKQRDERGDNTIGNGLIGLGCLIMLIPVIIMFLIMAFAVIAAMVGG